jgi:hypothetical protein
VPEYTQDEALAFVGAIRLAVRGKVGFKWLAEKLSDLEDHIRAVAGENERLNAYIDRTGARADYESQRAAGTDADAQGPHECEAGPHAI